MEVVHSGCHRKLTEDLYKERKEECDSARVALGVDDLCLLSDNNFEKTYALQDTIGKRARHCASEHKRTIKAAATMQQGDIHMLGTLMNDSHKSMRDNFEISLPEIDALVASAIEFGAHGARLTGGGFGGCIVACIANERLNDWKQSLLSRHSSAYFVC